MANELVIATAGAGKTRKIVEECISSQKAVWIVTYTTANLENLRARIIEKIGFVPVNIKIVSWFVFLLHNGVKPYINLLTDKKIRGIQFVQTQSAIKYKNKQGFPICYKEEKEFEKFYFNSRGDVYTDKLSRLFIRVNKKSEGKVINRLEGLVNIIYIDEVQDLAGLDLDIIKLLLQSNIDLRMVGDPRQVTYLTHFGKTYKKYKNGKIADFIRDKCKKFTQIIDEKSLSKSYRCVQEICDFVSPLFPEYDKIQSGNKVECSHRGIFTVNSLYIQNYLQKFQPTQLRNSKIKKTNDSFATLNFGISKGLTFDHVIIYPTSTILQWLKDNTSELKFTTRCNLYVAITRARFSVCFVVEKSIPGIIEWKPV